MWFSRLWTLHTPTGGGTQIILKYFFQAGLICHLHVWVWFKKEQQEKPSPLEPAVSYCETHSVHRPPKSAAQTHLGSIWSSRSPTAVSEVVDLEGPRHRSPPRQPNPPPPSPASSATWIMDHYSSTPGCMNHPCIMSACGRLGVGFRFHQYNTQPQVENMIQLLSSQILCLKM